MLCVYSIIFNVLFLHGAQVMRIDGVRRVNVNKNAGKPLFAFNGIIISRTLH